MAAVGFSSSLASLQISSAGLPKWNGLRPSHEQVPGVNPPARSPARKTIKAELRTAQGVENAQGSEKAFACISSTVPAPAPPAPSTLPSVLPALVGGGVVAAATFALLSKSDTPAEEQGTIAASATNGSSTSNGVSTVFVKRAAPAALATIAQHFPNAMQDERFVHAVAHELFNLGFTRDNCIALVNTCRDEVCRPLVNFIDREFGLSFNVSGLGGLVNCGKTGMKAGMSHSPEFPCDRDGKPRERYVFFAFPHVSIGETGEVGSLLRRGRGKPSSACGALIAIQNDAKKGGSIQEDPEDAEYLLLKKKVLAKPVVRSAGPGGPSLVDVTKAALQAITEDLETLIAQTVNPATADYAVITGVQIHSGNQVPGEPFRIERTVDYIAPEAMYAVIRGEKFLLHCEVNQISAIKSVPVPSVPSAV